MKVTSCAICASRLRKEIEKRDTLYTADKVIGWARSAGVNISRFTLAKHRANHLSKSPEEIDDNDSETIEIERRCQEPDRSSEGQSSSGFQADKCTVTETKRQLISDDDFLDIIKDTVYKKFLDGKITLSLTSALKAIEIKHKIGEESQIERTLLELMNEIRSDELRQKRMPADQAHE